MRQWQAEADAAEAYTSPPQPLQPPVAAETPGVPALVDRLSAAVAAAETAAAAAKRAAAPVNDAPAPKMIIEALHETHTAVSVHR